MKTLFLAIALSLSTLASADDAVSSQLLATLMRNVDSVKLINATEDETLASILSSALAVETLVADGKPVMLVSVSSKCELIERVSGNYKCSLTITNGDYVRKTGAYVGPELESALILEFETIKQRSISGRGGKHQLKGNKVKISRAG
jgi:hypothetical protein